MDSVRGKDAPIALVASGVDCAGHAPILPLSQVQIKNYLLEDFRCKCLCRLGLGVLGAPPKWEFLSNPGVTKPAADRFPFGLVVFSYVEQHEAQGYGATSKYVGKKTHHIAAHSG